jgi:hypothetical protein
MGRGPLKKEVAVKAKNPKLKVRALRKGVMGIERVYEDEEFFLSDISEFSPLWMEAINFDPPEPTVNQKKMLASPDHRYKFKGNTAAFDRTTNPGLVEESVEPEPKKASKKGKKVADEVEANDEVI